MEGLPAGDRSAITVGLLTLAAAALGCALLLGGLTLAGGVLLGTALPFVLITLVVGLRRLEAAPRSTAANITMACAGLSVALGLLGVWILGAWPRGWPGSG